MTVTQTQEFLKTNKQNKPSMRNSKKTTPKHLMVKLLKNQRQREILRAVGKKDIIPSKKYNTTEK